MDKKLLLTYDKKLGKFSLVALEMILIETRNVLPLKGVIIYGHVVGFLDGIPAPFYPC